MGGAPLVVAREGLAVAGAGRGRGEEGGALVCVIGFVGAAGSARGGGARGGLGIVGGAAGGGGAEGDVGCVLRFRWEGEEVEVGDVEGEEDSEVVD